MEKKLHIELEINLIIQPVRGERNKVAATEDTTEEIIIDQPMFDENGIIIK